MIKRTLYTVFAAAMLLAVSCTKDFEELDRPKTASDIIAPDALFTRSLVTGSGMSAGVWQWKHQISGSVYAQHFANIQTGPNFTADNYEPRAWNVVWNWYYAASGFAPLHYNYHVIKLSRDLENPIKEAVARIWNVYMIQQITDMYGDMPVFEAFESLRPQFDPQQDIYMFMLEELKEAVEMLDEFKGFGFEGYGQADVLFNGDLESWVRFANTMTLRLGLRASNTAEFNNDVLPYIQGIDIQRTINTNNQMVKIHPDAGGRTYHVENPIRFVKNWNEIRLSKTMFDILDLNNDPRLQVYADTNAFGEYAGLHNGQPHGLLSEQYDSYFRPNYSNIGSFFAQPNTPLYLLTAAESAFLKAEAAHRGFIAGSAEEYYNEGIRVSFEQFEITDEQIISDYLSGEAAFDPAEALEQIWTQRWIALYPNGHEAWSLVRRTGHPQMMQPVFTFPDNDQLPRRKLFPDAERLYNSANYESAVSRMGGDSQYTRVWWDGGN